MAAMVEEDLILVCLDLADEAERWLTECMYIVVMQ